jgi:hypothetical protein
MTRTALLCILDDWGLGGVSRQQNKGQPGSEAGA